MRVLPAPFQNAIAAMYWSLDASNPPLYFQSLSQMKDVRNKQVAQLSSSNGALDFLRGQDLSETLSNVFGSCATTATTTNDAAHHDATYYYYYGWISLALILLGNDWTDECHNLVTPLSWPDDIHFAHGPSLYAKVDPHVRTLATYVHSLV